MKSIVSARAILMLGVVGCLFWNVAQSQEAASSINLRRQPLDARHLASCLGLHLWTYNISNDRGATEQFWCHLEVRRGAVVSKHLPTNKFRGTGSMPLVVGFDVGRDGSIRTSKELTLLFVASQGNMEPERVTIPNPFRDIRLSKSELDNHVTKREVVLFSGWNEGVNQSDQPSVSLVLVVNVEEIK